MSHLSKAFRYLPRSNTALLASLGAKQHHHHQVAMFHTSAPRLLPVQALKNIDEDTADLFQPPETVDVFSDDTSPKEFLRKHDRKDRPISGEVAPNEMLVSTYRKQQHLGDTIAEMIAYWFVRYTNDENWGKAVIQMAKNLGAFKEKEIFFDYKELPFSRQKTYELHHLLKNQAYDQLQKILVDGKPKITVFVTGGTGFLGLDFLQRIATDDTVFKVICLVWNKEMGTKTSDEFKKQVLKRIEIPQTAYEKFSFVPGDVTKPKFGLSDSDLQALQSTCTHMIHLAASVSFEDPYDKMYRANVLSTQNALQFALEMQNAPNSRFVNYISTETCYIHGRDFELCREDELSFPRDYFNNYYELTKAVADIQTRHFMLATGLRVISLCPAITVGHSRTGNNHGDTKVINAAANAFGRINDEVKNIKQPLRSLVLRSVLNFPSCPTAKINIVPIDRVTDGLVASLAKPLATGERIHLGCGGISTGTFQKVFFEEIGIKIRYSNPVFHRNIRRPLLKMLFTAIKQEKLYRRLEVLFEIFGSYSEWGQPVHELGNDVRLLGLTANRPDLEDLGHMLVRHNELVQDWGRLRDPIEICRREKIWKDFLEGLEKRYGDHVGRMPSAMWATEVKNAGIKFEKTEKKPHKAK